MVCETTDVLSQIAQKYVVSRNLVSKNVASKTINDGLYQPSVIRVQHEHVVNLKCVGVSSHNENLKINRRARVNGIVYTSTYASQTKSIDYFVKMENNRIGTIIYFFEINSVSKLLLCLYKKNHQNFHWTEVDQTDEYEIHNVSDIVEKLLYFKVGRIQYVTKEPNSYGVPLR